MQRLKIREFNIESYTQIHVINPNVQIQMSIQIPNLNHFFGRNIEEKINVNSWASFHNSLHFPFCSGFALAIIRNQCIVSLDFGFDWSLGLGNWDFYSYCFGFGINSQRNDFWDFIS